MSERFYVNSPLACGPVRLEGAEARHLAAVCRLRPGDQVYLFNGDGKQYRAEVAGVERRHVELRVFTVEEPARELGFRLEVAAPLPKGDRAQFLVEKLTELGVTDFVPLLTERSVIQPGASHLEKLRRYVIESSKQCGRNTLLRIAAPTSWRTYAFQQTLPAQRMLAHPSAAVAVDFERCDSALAVGPEGGWTDEEVALAGAAGWRKVGLGPRTLRVETAALLLAAWVLAPAW